jgi:glycosyltransferase involved in cell wall biosynthesis
MTGGVLQVVAPAPFGGIESVVQALTRASLARGHRVHVATLLQDNSPHPFAEHLKTSGVPVAEVRCGRRRYFAEARAVARIARERDVSVIHSHNYHADVVALLAARMDALPLVSTVHGFSEGDWKNRLYERGDRWLLRYFDAVICVSDSIRDRLIRSGCPADRLTVIQNGYGPSTFLDRNTARARLGLHPTAAIAGWVGRLQGAKGADLLVSALATPSAADTQLVVIGDGPDRDLVLRSRDQCGISPDRLRFLGARENAAELLPAFDALVLSSRTEGTPMVILEAMAARVPVVSFAVGGIPNILDEASAWLVPPLDVSGLGTAIHAALSDPAARARKAATAAEILRDRFGVEQWLARVEQVYDTVRRKRRPRSSSKGVKRASDVPND